MTGRRCFAVTPPPLDLGPLDRGRAWPRTAPARRATGEPGAGAVDDASSAWSATRIRAGG